MTNEFQLLKADIEKVEKQVIILHSDVKKILFNNGKLFGVNIAMGIFLPIIVTIVVELVIKR